MNQAPEIDGYLIHRLIGRGGMARVYGALETALEREVAIKVVSIDSAEQQDLLTRLSFEAKALAQLRHPHIVELYRFGQIDAKTLYYVMPLLTGGDLSLRQLPRSEVEVKALLEPLLDALGYAHQAGIVHRDVKPENVMFDSHGRPQLADFGAAFSLAASRLTQEGFAIGSLGYMSPEQARGQPISHSSDLYSLAVLAFEQLTGRRSHRGGDALAIALAQIEQPHAPLPAELRHWGPFFQRALAPMSAHRFQDAAEMRAALPEAKLTEPVPVMHTEGPADSLIACAQHGTADALLANASARVSGPTAIVVTGNSTTRLLARQPPPSTPQRHKMRRNLLYAAAAAALVGLAALGLWLQASTKAQQALQLQAQMEADIDRAALKEAPRLFARYRSQLDLNKREAIGARVANRLGEALQARSGSAEFAELAASYSALASFRRQHELPESPAAKTARGVLSARVAGTLELAAQTFDVSAAQQAFSLAELLAAQDVAVAEALKKARAIPAIGGTFTDASGLALRLVQAPSTAANGQLQPGVAIMAQPLSQAQFEQFAEAGNFPPDACPAMAALPARACFNQPQAEALIAWLETRGSTRFSLPTRARWNQLRQYAPTAANIGALSRECRMQSFTQKPNALARTWGGVRKVFGGKSAVGKTTRYCDGELSFALDGTGNGFAAVPEKTVLVLIAELK